MPPRKRGGAFGGNLLNVPTPLPEDDDQASVEPAAFAAVADVAPQSPPEAPEASAEHHDAELPEAQAQPATGGPDQMGSRTRRSRGSGPAASGTGRERPPATIRLDDRAAPQLWDAYVEAKNADPFLSYRQFASGVVLDGLEVHRRRLRRS